MIQIPSELIKEVPIKKSVVRYADIPSLNSVDPDTAIFFIAGQKSPLERFFPMAEYFAQYYRTYAYEIPGMGIHLRNPESPATIKSLSTEIAEFINNIIEEENVLIIAASAGFWFSTQALLLEESLTKKVKKIVSIVGMLGKDTFGFSRTKRALVLALCNASLSKVGSKMIDWLLSKEPFIDFYSRLLVKSRKLGSMPTENMHENLEFEKFLLRLSNWNIHFSTVAQYLTTETPTGKFLEIPVFALYSAKDQFFPYANQKKTFEKVYTSIEWDQIHLKAHSPLVVKSFSEYKDVIPEERILEFLKS